MSASPDTSPFDQNLSELSDNEPSTSTSSSVPRIKLKIRLNPTPSYSDHDRGPDDNSSRKHKRKKKRSHKKHKHAKHSDDNDKPHGQQHRRHSELVDIDDYDDYGSDDNIGNGNSSMSLGGGDLASAHSPQADEGLHYQHIPVGGKRPFAMLQQQQQQQQQQQPEDDTYVNGKDAHHPHLYRQATPYEDDEDGYSDEDNQMDDSNNNNNNNDDDDGEYEYDHDDGALDETNVYHPTDTTTAATKKAKSGRSGKTSNKAAKSKKKSSKQLQSRTSTETTAQKKRGRPTKKAQAKTVHTSHSFLTQQQYHLGHLATKDYKKDLKAACLKLWDNLSKRDDYGFFLEPVNTKLVRDYLTVIKQPMDFSTLRHKIENDSYSTMDDFRADFLLIVRNAKLYNAPDTIYWKSADKLESYGIKAIDRAEKLVQESFASQPSPPPPSSTLRGNNRQYSWQQQQHSRKDSTTVKEEEVDILGLDGPARKASRAESERTTREPSLDTSLSRATTPMRQHMKKKKKKKMTDAGVIYGPDGSIHAIGGVNDLHSLLPMKQSFSDRPQLTTINPQALPSAFYQVNRSIHDDWANHKHFIQPSVFCDYGPFPFTTLGSSTPVMFYRPQDAHYVFPLYGDDTGEAYLKSVWQYMGDLGLDEKATSLSRHITRGAYDVVAAVIDNMDLVTEKKVESPTDCDDDIDIDTDGAPNNISDTDDSILVETEFGTVNVGALLKELQQQQPSVSGAIKVDGGETLNTQEPLQSNHAASSLPATSVTEPTSTPQGNAPLPLGNSVSSGPSPLFSPNSSHSAPYTTTT